jgi:mono/diheme cytochrome c family protein
MVATWAIVLFFVLLALGVVFVAMSGGRTRTRGANPSRESRAMVWLGTAAVVVLVGVVVPILVLIGNKDTQASQGPGGVNLTAADQHGREVFYMRCGQCHTLKGANAVGRVGPDLDLLRPPKALTINAIEQGRAGNIGQMPAGVIDGEEAENVANFVAKVAGR